MNAATRLLVVDLDADLLNTDLRAEQFWASLSRRWSWLAGHGAPSSSSTASKAGLNASLLPVREDTLRALHDWRQGGGQTALITSRADGLAEIIAVHLDLFDKIVTGPDQAPSDWMSTRLGSGPLFGLGATSGRPEPVEAKALSEAWGRTRSRRAVNPSLILRAIRPHQWLKNLLIFIPILASHRLTPDTLVPATAAFVAFCLIASGAYLLNDLLDLEADRAHPRKRNRPFASGRLPLRTGSLLLPAMILTGAAIATALGPAVAVALAVYFIGTVLYSLVLKRLVIIDICTLAALYVLRIVVGGAATATPLSIWLIMFALFFFFALAAVKRQGELVDLPARGVESALGRGYTVADLSVVTTLATSSGFVSVLVLALFVNSDTTRQLYAHPSLLWGIIPILLYWLSRMVFLTQRGMMHDDPLIFAARDRVSQTCLLLMLGLILGAANT